MSNQNQNLHCLAIRMYGGAATDQAARSSVNTAGQKVAETLAISTSTNNRRFPGPKKRGHVTIHVFNATASGATSALNIGYSNLPDPDPAVDADWVDSGITPVVLTTTATGTFVQIKDVVAEWIRLQPSVLTSAGSLWCWVRSEGSDTP